MTRIDPDQFQQQMVKFGVARSLLTQAGNNIADALSLFADLEGFFRECYETNKTANESLQHWRSKHDNLIRTLQDMNSDIARLHETTRPPLSDT